MKRILGLIAALALLQVSTPASADPPQYAKTVSTCGTPGSTPVAGNPQPMTIDTTGVLCTSSSGGGGGSASYTAAASPYAVAAGVNKPAGISTTNSAQWTVPVKPGTTTEIDLSVAPTGAATSANQTTIITNSGSAADSAYTGTGASQSAMLRAIADAAISTAATKVKASPSSTSTDGIAPIVSAAAESCHVLKASAGNLYSVSGVIGAAGYIMVFDATSAPVDGAVTPKVWAYAGAQGTFSISYGLMPAVFATGITVCASSTGPFTKTAYSTNTAFSGQIQ